MSADNAPCGNFIRSKRAQTRVMDWSGIKRKKMELLELREINRNQGISKDLSGIEGDLNGTKGKFERN